MRSLNEYITVDESRQGNLRPTKVRMSLSGLSKIKLQNEDLTATSTT